MNYQNTQALGQFSSILQVLAMFLFFYNIPLQLFKIPFSSGKLITILALGYFTFIFLFRPIKNELVNKNYLFYISAVAVSFLIVFILIKIVYNTEDNYYLTTFLLYIVEYLLGAFFIIRIFKLYSLTKVLYSIIILSVLQASIMFCSLFVEPLKSFVVAVMEANPDFALFSKADTIKDSFRGLSLASDRTLGMSIFFSISIMLIYLYILISNERINNFKFVFFFVIIFCGGVLAARTFFIGLAIGFLFLVMLILKFSQLSNRLKYYFLRVFITISVLIILTPVIISLYFSDVKEEIDLAFNWMFEVFINSDKEGFEKSESLYDLVYNNLTVLPDSWHTFLIGDSNRTFNNGIHYKGVDTDSGYLRMIFVYGMIGSMAVYIFWIVILKRTSSFYDKKEAVNLLMIFIGFLLFIAQIKYDVFPSSALNLKLILVFFVLGIERKRQII
jgi:hypothetical protein